VPALLHRRGIGQLEGDVIASRRSNMARAKAKNPKKISRKAGRLQRAVDEAKRREIEAALRETGGNASEAARLLGISRVHLWMLARDLGVDIDSFRG
jgi:DNA-binding NtrC family response regulator